MIRIEQKSLMIMMREMITIDSVNDDSNLEDWTFDKSWKRWTMSTTKVIFYHWNFAWKWKVVTLKTKRNKKIKKMILNRENNNR